ncbi:MAG TPA: spore photoproduct lyase family protein [Clostridia bacterium]|nr:spore photoproduct lyase family protein [Clostridia bacterium]
MRAEVDHPTRVLSVDRIYFEPAVIGYLRGQEIFNRFPEAERIEVRSHWQIPELHGNQEALEEWVQVKRTNLVLGVRKTAPVVTNGRSGDFIAPGHANGCAMACVYCYVPRRKGYANPITVFVNIEQICASIARHAAKLGTKSTPNQVDPKFWVYDIGCNSDCSVDDLISDNVRDVLDLFKRLPNAKASFATKFVNRDLLDYDPKGKVRIRFSLMPADLARVVDVRTSNMADRISAINDFFEAGYEVHLNFSPVIYSSTWQADYAELFDQIDSSICGAAKQQLAAEIIFLTHNEAQHQMNLQWHPKAEELLWQPELQEQKVSLNGGGVNLRYRRGFKGQLVQEFCALLKAKMPYCRVRYAF